MSNDETTSELAKLRAELAALKETQREQAAPSPAQGIPGEEAYAESSAVKGGSSTTPDAADAKATDAAAGDVEAGEEEVKSQLDELAALLEHEIRDLPTITCLTVFSLGILMGRLLR
jgi:creatinine amidohydrolase/Fe(II)-dependent formamide hydrolase-like protein